MPSQDAWNWICVDTVGAISMAAGVFMVVQGYISKNITLMVSGSVWSILVSGRLILIGRQWWQMREIRTTYVRRHVTTGPTRPYGSGDHGRRLAEAMTGLSRRQLDGSDDESTHVDMEGPASPEWHWDSTPTPTSPAPAFSVAVVETRDRHGPMLMHVAAQQSQLEGVRTRQITDTGITRPSGNIQRASHREEPRQQERERVHISVDLDDVDDLEAANSNTHRQVSLHDMSLRDAIEYISAHSRDAVKVYKLVSGAEELLMAVAIDGDDNTAGSEIIIPPEAECNICLGGLVKGQRICKLPCEHFSFHSHCISEWLRHNNICPICRARVHKPMQTLDRSRST